MIENMRNVCLWPTCDEKSKRIGNLRNGTGNDPKQLALDVWILAFVQTIDDNESGMGNQGPFDFRASNGSISSS
jgi:hypothetical protein